MPYKQENKENIYDFIHRWAKNKRDYGVEKHEIAPVSLKTSEAGAFLYSVSNGGFFNYLLVNGVRRPSSRELLRLQGFPEKFRIVVSHQDIRRQTGNSVAIPMIRMVAEKIYEIIKKHKNEASKTQGWKEAANL